VGTRWRARARVSDHQGDALGDGLRCGACGVRAPQPATLAERRAQRSTGQAPEPVEHAPGCPFVAPGGDR
jgi:hypothetical protein